MEILCKFFPDFQTWNRIFFWFCKKTPTFFQNCAHLFPLNFIWANFERKKKTFLSSVHFHFTTRTGAVGLGRFRLVHSRWSTAGEKLFFSYFFFLYIFSFFFLFCLFLLFLLGLNAARARLGGFKIKIRLKCYKGIPS